MSWFTWRWIRAIRKKSQQKTHPSLVSFKESTPPVHQDADSSMEIFVSDSLASIPKATKKKNMIEKSHTIHFLL